MSIFSLTDILNAVFNRDANKLKVETDLQIDAVTVTDVTIHDAVATDNKLKVNEDGSVPVELKGSLMQEYSFNDIPITAGATLVRYFNFTGNIEDIVINIGVTQSLTQKLSPKYMFNLARYGYTATSMLIPIPAHVDTVKGFVSTKFDVLGSKMRVDITNPETETDIDVNIAIRAFIRGSAENANVLMTTS
jgi:hypothetical protein